MTTPYLSVVNGISNEFSVIEVHLSHSFCRNAQHRVPHAVGATGGGRSSMISWRIFGEEICRDRYLRHLKRDTATVTDVLRAVLDQRFLETGEQPILDRLGRRRGA